LYILIEPANYCVSSISINDPFNQSLSWIILFNYSIIWP